MSKIAEYRKIGFFFGDFLKNEMAKNKGFLEVIFYIIHRVKGSCRFLSM